MLLICTGRHTYTRASTCTQSKIHDFGVTFIVRVGIHTHMLAHVHKAHVHKAKCIVLMYMYVRMDEWMYGCQCTGPVSVQCMYVCRPLWGVLDCVCDVFRFGYVLLLV